MILLISRNKKRGNEYAEIFHYMGVLNTVATPTEALSEISLLYRAVLIIEPVTIADPADLVRKLKSYASLPIFAISEDGPNDQYAHLFDIIQFRNGDRL